jgi:hypothetical protein
MKVKTPKNSPIAVLYTAAKEIIDGTRAVFEKQGKDARELRIPILMHGTDLRVTIESGPQIAARNAIENAQMQASGKPVEPTVDMSAVINEAKALIAQYASEANDRIHNATPPDPADQRLHERCMGTLKGLFEVERLL